MRPVIQRCDHPYTYALKCSIGKGSVGSLSYICFQIIVMKFPSPVSLKWIAELIDAKLAGNTEASATGINEIHRVEEGDLVFVDHPKYYDKSLNSAASFIIINTETTIPEGKALLITENPFEAYKKIVAHFRPFSFAQTMISDKADIDPSAKIFPGVFIADNVRIGKNSIIQPGVYVHEHCNIGDDCFIQSGTVIGSNAFYYNGKKNREVWYEKMPDCGRVIIHDKVEIGANCTIDRGVTSDTTIGRGTKLDNMIHIGHDTVIGENCLLAAGVMIAGATTLGNGVTVWGQVGINKTLHIGDNATILAQSGVGHDLEAGKTYWGVPAEAALSKKKELIWIKRIPEIWEKVNPKNEDSSVA